MIGTGLFQNPRLLLLVVGMIVLAGLASLQVIPRMEDPVLSRRVSLVMTEFPGADARRVESLVTEVLEEKLRDIEQIQEIQSTSSASSSVIVIELRDEVVDVEPVWSLVRDKLADAELPAEVSRPRLRTLELKAYASIIALKWNHDQPPNFATLRRLADKLKQSLLTLPGTERADVFGDPGEEIVVEVEPAVLSALNLTTSEIANQLQGADAKRGAGLLHGDRNNLLMAIESDHASPAQLWDTPIIYGQRGQLANLGDIATISRQAVEPLPRAAIIDGQPAVAIGVFVRDDYRIDEWTADMEETLDAFSSELADGIEADVIFKQNNYVGDRLHTLFYNLLLGTAAVVVVVFIAMGWRSMLVVAAALPLSACMVLIGMRVLGIPIHQMSITGLIIALGLLIDNAIVIVDEIRARLEKGLAPVQAIREGIHHLAMPLFGSTLTTALAFAPIALLPGAPGEFVRGVAISVILAITSSFLLAMTVVPAMTGLLQRPTCQTGRRTTFWNHGISSRWLTNLYRKSLEVMLRMPLLVMLLGMALPVLGFLQIASLTEQFFPAADRDQIQIEVELEASAPLAQTRSVAATASEIATAHEEVERVHWFLGQSAPTFYYNVVPRRPNATFYGQAIVELAPGANPRDVVRQLQSDLDDRLADCRVLVRQLEQGPPFDAPIEVRIAGPDVATLQSLGSKVRLLLSQTPQVVHTRSDLEESAPKLALQVDPVEARLSGLSEGEITRQLFNSVTGADGGSLSEGVNEIPVRVRLADSARKNVQGLDTLTLKSPIERPELESPTMGTLIRPELTSDLATLTRINGQRVNEVKAYLTAGTLPAEVKADFEQRLADSDFELPAGYSLEFGGEAAKRDQAVRNLMADIVVLVALMVGAVVISFRSFRIAGIISAVGGLSIGLGFLAIWLFDFPFGFMAILGTMGLVGVAINDAIVVTAGIRENTNARLGDVSAISEVIVSKTRHVLATSLTTMAGFTPLVLGGGGFWPPLAITIAGGVGGATILALYFVPSFYLLVMCTKATRARITGNNSLSDA